MIDELVSLNQANMELESSFLEFRISNKKIFVI